MKTILQKTGMLFAMLCAYLSATAYDIEVDGIYYTITSFTDLTCKVTSGDNEYQGDIVIPSEIIYKSRNLSVTSIDYRTFFSCDLTSVTIPNSVTSIGKSAFKNCIHLTLVTIPNSVTSIGESAFENCRGLTQVIIGNSVTYIGKNTFRDCSSLASVTIPNSVTSIGEYAFCDCSSLASVTIPNSVTFIGEYAFCDCSSLASVTTPNSVIEIGAGAFCRCKSLESVTIPNSVISIGKFAFCYCSSLTSVTIPNSVIEIGAGAFSGCKSLEFIKLPNTLKRINYGMFKDCESLKTLDIPGSINFIAQCCGKSPWDIDYYTFSSGLLNFRMLYSEEKLGVGWYDNKYNEFNNSNWSDWTKSIKTLYIDRPLDSYIPVPNLEKLELGPTVDKVEVKDINILTKLVTIESYAVVPPKLPEMSNAHYINVDVLVPEEALEAYKADPVWGKFWNLQASGVDDVKIESKKEVIGRYDMNGRAVSEDYQGLVIVRFSDGSTKKSLQ